ncbi:MAG TPA: amidohydrolase family protein [Terriglobia bacterium]|nr:amidohydrolase family protein [Terriglobia bacterium]
MSKNKKNSVGRRGFLTGAAALLATAQSGSLLHGKAQNSPAPAAAEDWLSLTKEDALERELPVIDPHHHFWNTPDRDPQRYLLEQLAADVKGNNVRQTVFIECGSMYRADGPEEFRVVGETEFVQGIAAESASGRYGDLRAAAGIVGTVDLRLGDRAAPVFEAHIAASRQRFRGIRHGGAWMEPGVLPSGSAAPRSSNRPAIVQHLLLDSNFRRAYAYLQNYGLTFEGWVYHPQIAELTDLAKAFPDTTIIFNHLGGPIGVGLYAGRRDEVFAVWKTAIAELARCPNVVAKVGGIQMAVNGYGWHERKRPPTSDELLAANRDWYLYTIDRFGPTRCMFESNFPVDRLSCSYTVVWNQFKKLTKGFSPSERSAMFHDTAMRVYRLPRH